MKLVIQRVSRAEVRVEASIVGKIGIGLLVLSVAGFIWMWKFTISKITV